MILSLEKLICKSLAASMASKLKINDQSNIFMFILVLHGFLFHIEGTVIEVATMLKLLYYITIGRSRNLVLRIFRRSISYYRSYCIELHFLITVLLKRQHCITTTIFSFRVSNLHHRMNYSFQLRPFCFCYY